jgi:hypothetical protein
LGSPAWDRYKCRCAIKALQQTAAADAVNNLAFPASGGITTGRKRLS